MEQIKLWTTASVLRGAEGGEGGAVLSLVVLGPELEGVGPEMEGVGPELEGLGPELEYRGVIVEGLGPELAVLEGLGPELSGLEAELGPELDEIWPELEGAGVAEGGLEGLVWTCFCGILFWRRGGEEVEDSGREGEEGVVDLKRCKRILRISSGLLLSSAVCGDSLALFLLFTIQLY
jgi:hypothetical protein